MNLTMEEPEVYPDCLLQTEPHYLWCETEEKAGYNLEMFGVQNLCALQIPRSGICL